MGAFCTSAVLSPLDERCQLGDTARHSLWRKWNTTVGVAYRWRLRVVPDGGQSPWVLYDGGSCLTLHEIAAGTERPYARDVTFTATGSTLWFEINVSPNAMHGYTQLILEP